MELPMPVVEDDGVGAPVEGVDAIDVSADEDLLAAGRGDGDRTHLAVRSEVDAGAGRAVMRVLQQHARCDAMTSTSVRSTCCSRYRLRAVLSSNSPRKVLATCVAAVLISLLGNRERIGLTGSRSASDGLADEAVE